MAEVYGSASGKLGSKGGVFAWICRPRSVWRFRIKKKPVKDGLRDSCFNQFGSIKNTVNGPGAAKSRIDGVRFVSKWREQQIPKVPTILRHAFFNEPFDGLLLFERVGQF